MAPMAKYSVNDAGVAHARELIDKHRHVLRSSWGDVQPKAADENAYLKKHCGTTAGTSGSPRARARRPRAAARSSSATSAGCTGRG